MRRLDHAVARDVEEALDGNRKIGAAAVVEDEAELVAGIARDTVTGARDAAQALRQRGNDFVRHLEAIGLVDDVEIADGGHCKGTGGLAAAGLADRLLEGLIEARAVHHAGQRIGVRERAQHLVAAVALVDRADNAEGMGRAAVLAGKPAAAILDPHGGHAQCRVGLELVFDHIGHACALVFAGAVDDRVIAAGEIVGIEQGCELLAARQRLGRPLQHRLCAHAPGQQIALHVPVIGDVACRGDGQGNAVGILGGECRIGIPVEMRRGGHCHAGVFCHGSVRRLSCPPGTRAQPRARHPDHECKLNGARKFLQNDHG